MQSYAAVYRATVQGSIHPELRNRSSGRALRAVRHLDRRRFPIKLPDPCTRGRCYSTKHSLCSNTDNSTNTAPNQTCRRLCETTYTPAGEKNACYSSRDDSQRYATTGQPSRRGQPVLEEDGRRLIRGPAAGS